MARECGGGELRVLLDPTLVSEALSAGYDWMGAWEGRHHGE